MILDENPIENRNENTEKQRVRYFRWTVLTSISLWLALSLIPQLIFSLLGVHRILPSSVLVVISECCVGISSGLLAALSVHIAIWWLRRHPNNSGIWSLLLIASSTLIPMVYQLGDWIIFYDRYESDMPGGAMPIAMVLVSAISSLLTIPWCMVTIQLLSPIIGLRLQDSKVTPTAHTNDRNWSIRGLMLLTFLVAVDLSIREYSNQMIRKHFKGTVVNFDPGNPAGLMLLGFMWRVIRVCVIVLAGWAVMQSAGEELIDRRRNKKIQIVLLGAAIVVGYLINMLYLVLYSQSLGDFFFWSNTALPTFFRKLCDFTAVYFISVWLFRRWRKAGYQIEGWLIGRGAFLNKTVAKVVSTSGSQPRRLPSKRH